MIDYVPKPNSVAARAIAYLESLPPGTEMMTSALAEAINVPGGNMAPNLEAPLTHGLLYRRQRDTHVRSPWWWSLTNYRAQPKAAWPPKPAAPAAAQPSGARNTERHPKGDQPRSERGREGMEPQACESAGGRGTNGAPALATPPHDASPVGGPMGAGQPAAAGPIKASSPGTPQMRVALWSDGALVIVRGVETMALQPEETRALVRYLERMVDEPAGSAAQ